MADKLFLIGVGGTGMRCLESFVHLCAAGMLSGREIHMLALDTDLENGNFRRLKSLVLECYCKIKGSGGAPSGDTFFGAKLNLYSFTPDYRKAKSFTDIDPFASQEHKDLASLLLSKSVREFDLLHGYRAQTHLGSMMMYHSIIDAVAENKKCDLGRFINNLNDEQKIGNEPDARCFVLGSVFGGTGASSISIIPKAFSQASENYFSSKLDGVSWGATLLTSYFHFDVPQQNQLDNEKVIASSKYFNLNSQAAMLFYDEDKTVKKNYQKFYIIGAPGETINMSADKQGDKVVTGGEKQENPCHYIELICAGAAFDFFNTTAETLNSIRERTGADCGPDYHFRGINKEGLKFNDFIQEPHDDELTKRLAMLVVLSLLANKKEGFFDKVFNGGIKNLPTEYKIEASVLTALKKYFNYFHYSFDDQKPELIKDGWLRQLWKSAGQGDKFLFHPELFAISNTKSLNDFKFNKRLYADRLEKKYTYDYTPFISSPYDAFETLFKTIQNPNDSSFTGSEKVLKRTYESLCDLYKFSRSRGA